MAKNWPSNPKIYQINTWVWLDSLSQKYNKRIKLGNVPESEIDTLATYHVDAIWMMGVWHRGPATRASALNYIREYRGALPDIKKRDVIGSAYAIHDYEVDPGLGGRGGLAKFREQLQQHGLKLLLDFVPNHVSTDHHWITERPDYFVKGTPELLDVDPGNFFSAEDPVDGRQIIAHGRDPYFPGWIDTAQLNAFSPGYREAAIATLKDIADQCDGVRCDMAMLMMNDIFKNTWGWLGLNAPRQDFWPYVIPKVLRKNPDFLFIAETYWGLDYALHVQGFDFTYDKTLYDRLVMGDVDGLYAHLIADINFLRKNVRFIENHDEPRAASEFGIERSKPAAVMICTLPGATLLHDGQFWGRHVKLPVQIRRQPDEELDMDLFEFYQTLLAEASNDIYRTGEWRMFHRGPVTDKKQTGHEHVVAYGWQNGEDCRLILLNMADENVSAMIDLDGWGDALYPYRWQAEDALTGTTMSFSGDEVSELGLPIEMDPYDMYIFRLMPVGPSPQRKKRKKKPVKA
ncbi:alpha-amylase [Phototrophicus methaneseepsis]|uniref:Alpha-amylase n=1 Tax=Phototrophicus methaneseepsis TaxID=2710758 RepID=A0A7S8EDA4_9CHLR|nr:alpha-amylase family glycosyl hydrolase [Phototrophicus methaneseepsis]QPC84862.1 alpha-amylase [Phototrophicus methaneseepsis]